MIDSPERILVVDDDPNNTELIRELCQSLGYTVETARDGFEALGLIEADRPDLVLLDIGLPRMDGFDVLRRIKENETTADLPVIIVTAMADIDDKVKGIELGADDYLTKPFKLFELQTRIGSALSVRRYQDRLRSAERGLADTADADTLTGAGQFAQLHAHLDYEVTRARRYGRPLAALLVSVDEFMAFCDEHGRPAGDEVLQALADVVRTTTRDVDRLYRFDVEEFVVLLPETPLAGAVVVAERIQNHVRTVLEGQRPFTCSVGVAAFPHAEVRGGEDLLTAADEAMRAARQAGPGHVAVFGE